MILTFLPHANGFADEQAALTVRVYVGLLLTSSHALTVLSYFNHLSWYYGNNVAFIVASFETVSLYRSGTDLILCIR